MERKDIKVAFKFKEPEAPVKKPRPVKLAKPAKPNDACSEDGSFDIFPILLKDKKLKQKDVIKFLKEEAERVNEMYE